MEIYKTMMIQDLKGELFLPLQKVQVIKTQHINEGAKPVRGGIGNPLIGMFGGKSYISIQCLNVADKIKPKFGNQKVNIYLINDNLQEEILNVSIQYKENDILIETEKIKVLKVNK